MQLNFKNIIGNDKIKKELEDLIVNNRISHSYLFLGQEGIGKKLFAKEFAKMELCLEQNKACNLCSSCLKFNSNNNPDFMIIHPDGNYIKIFQIREMQENVYKKPIIAKKKVIIIDDSDKMTEEAQNSLLKILEEPPEYIIIILIASNENKLLNTIKSRCLKINFDNIENEKIIEYINNQQIMTDTSDNLLRMCNGSIGKLIKINQNLDEYKEIDKSINGIIKNNIKNEIELFNKFNILYNSREIIMDLLDYMIIIIYENIRKEKDYRRKFVKIISAIESVKSRLMLNSNYDMCIDKLLLKIWEEINEKSSRS